MVRSRSFFIAPPARRIRAVAVPAILLTLAFAPLAWAQTDTPADSTTPAKPKKKKPKPAPAAAAAPPVDDSAAAPPPAPPPAPEPVASAPAASAGATVVVTAPVAALPESAPGESSTDTNEDPNKRYIFVGLRYRGTLIPQFIESLFVSEGANIYSNTVGAEIDIRKGGQSVIPWIQYTDYNSGDILFLQKGQDAQNPAFYSVVNSSLKSVYVGIDELWSTRIANHLDFEYGFGVGVGVIFGDLQNNWVFQNNGGPFTASNGLHLSECGKGGMQPGCRTGDHSNATVAKVGGYVEPNWFNAGAVPVILPHIAVPQLSLRYKPIKQLETRLSIGFSLTGFWFGLSADYGLEKTDEAPTGTVHKSSFGTTAREPL